MTGIIDEIENENQVTFEFYLSTGGDFHNVMRETMSCGR
jgi:hypothetical protein